MNFNFGNRNFNSDSLGIMSKRQSKPNLFSTTDLTQVAWSKVSTTAVNPTTVTPIGGYINLNYTHVINVLVGQVYTFFVTVNSSLSRSFTIDMMDGSAGVIVTKAFTPSANTLYTTSITGTIGTGGYMDVRFLSTGGDILDGATITLTGLKLQL